MIEKIVDYLQKHWVEIGLIWVTIQNVLKGVQDSLDSIPKGAPLLTRIVAIMRGVSMYLFTGNRPTPIKPPTENTK